MLSKGLEDSWSEIRYAASLAVRSFYIIANSNIREQFDRILIPRMCLNRYYDAAGVQIYS